MTIQVRRGKIAPLPPETLARFKPYRASRDRQDEIFDNGGMKAPRIRVERQDVVEDKIVDPVAEEKRARGETVAIKRTVTAHRVQSRLERMKKRKEITELECKAGLIFAEDTELSSVSVKSCLLFDGGGNDPALTLLANSTAAASNRVRKALDALGIALWPVVVWVAIEGQPASEWAAKEGLKAPDKTGTGILRIALRRLVDHYRLDSERRSGI